MEITLCLIVKNEEKKLPACLESFRGVFQKLVVVDTGSADQSKKIAHRFGAEVFDFEWIKNFAAARNFALQKVETAWTMMVDADDMIEEQTKLELLEKLDRLGPETAGIFLPYLYSNIRKGLGNMAYLPRIWRSDLGLRYVLPVHEYLNVPPQLLEKFIRIDAPILHNKSEEDFSKSFPRNIEILEHAHAHGEAHPRILFYLGLDNFYAGNIQASLKWFEKFLQLRTKHPHEAYKAHMMIAKIHLKRGETEEAKKDYMKAIGTCPDFLEPHILLGDLAMAEKNYDKAVQYYNDALHCKPPRTHIFLNTHLNLDYAERKLSAALTAIERQPS